MSERVAKTAVITGAGSGIGRELALECAARGMRLCLTDISRESLGETERALQAYGVDVQAYVIDVANQQEMMTFADRAYERFGRVDWLFNNAGVFTGGPAWTTTEAEWRWCWEVNVMGVVHGIQAFVPRMLRDGDSGHIINTASVGGLICPPGYGAYSASKHAVVAISESLLHDLKGQNSGINVSVVCPGFVKTNITSDEHLSRIPKDNQRHARDIFAKTTKAMDASDKSANDVARMALDGVLQNRFYIITHEGAHRVVERRFKDLLEGSNPADPMAEP